MRCLWGYGRCNVGGYKVRYLYTCHCGVTLEAASDKGLHTALARHIGASQIHLAYEHGLN